ncbi:GlcG/HbpS family heme-binding protein [Mesorhizobium sp. URHB0026]
MFALEISERKAYTSALVRLRTADILPLVQPGQPLYALPTVGGGRFCPMGGGIPLVDEEGKVYAGVGVSGGTADEDVAIAEAAVR